MSNDNYPARNRPATIEDDYLTADETVVGNPYVGPQQGNTQLDPYGSPYQQDVPTVSPGGTAPQRRIVQDAPTADNRPRVAQQGHPADNRAHGHAQRAYDWPPATSAYGPNSYDPSPVDFCASGRQSPQQATAQRFRCGASALRWIVRLLCLGLLVFGAMTIYYLTEQSVADTSALSSSAGLFAEYGAYLVQSGQLPAFEENPIKWTAAHILLLSVKFSNHGLSVRQQAHVVEFALMGGVIALNVLAWMSGRAHRRSSRGPYPHMANLVHVRAERRRRRPLLCRPISQALCSWPSLRQARFVPLRLRLYFCNHLRVYRLEYLFRRLSTRLSKVI